MSQFCVAKTGLDILKFFTIFYDRKFSNERKKEKRNKIHTPRNDILSCLSDSLSFASLSIRQQRFFRFSPAILDDADVLILRYIPVFYRDALDKQMSRGSRSLY